jgi:glycosyltransferase involved in cell wall biosynthesis
MATSGTTPFLSVVIGVHNDWEPLAECLSSLAQQKSSPDFEVIIVDDGSIETAPEAIREWERHYPLIIHRQAHSGVSTARNRGVQQSRGSVILFVDADSRAEENCLAALVSAIAGLPQHNCFQLHLTGHGSTLVGRAEGLRLITLENHLLQPDGCIRYLNTAGFAIRKSRIDLDCRLFDPAAHRAEDTLLLADLIQSGELPFFVSDAIVQHIVPLSLIKCFRKDLRAAYVETRAYAIIASRGLTVRVDHKQRLHMLSSMWSSSKDESIGRSAFFVAVARQVLSRSVSILCDILRIQSSPETTR